MASEQKAGCDTTSSALFSPQSPLLFQEVDLSSLSISYDEFLNSSLVRLAVKNVWGWDPLSLICWISITNIRERNSWEVGSFYAWLITSMVVATASTLVVIGHLARYAYRRDRKFSFTNGTGSSSGAIVRALSWRITLYPSILSACFFPFRLLIYQAEGRGMEVVNNCISAAANFVISGTGGIESESTFVIWCMSQFFYGALPLFYALVSIFVE